MIMRIRELREKKGMTQRELAAAMNVIQNAVSNWENEVALPRARELPTLAAVLECSIGELFVDGAKCNNFGKEEVSVCRE